MSKFCFQTLSQSQEQSSVRHTRDGKAEIPTRRAERERVKQEEKAENFVFLSSISVTRVTPGLYVNMTKERLCPSSVSLQSPVLSSQ